MTVMILRKYLLSIVDIDDMVLCSDEYAPMQFQLFMG